MVALIGFLNLAFGSDPDARGPVVVSQASDEPEVRSPAPTTTTSPTAVPTASPTAVATPASTPPTTASATAAPTRLRAPLRVYNYSRRSQLALRAAAEFERAGWEVVEVTNTRVRTEVTTVYYAPGQEAVAAQLRAEFPDIKATAPRPAALAGSGLTVVVTREYPA